MVPDHSKGLLESDLNIITIAFDPANTLPTTRKLNDSIIEKCEADIKWWECGAEEYRRRRAAGETPFPPAVKLDNTSEFIVRSTKGGHDISCRVFGDSERFTPRGVLYHIHGGGFVIGSASGQDIYLDEISKRTQLLIVSVEYRLAPEFPYPAAAEDCYEVAEWLIANSRSKWGCELRFIAGESAGATLSSLVLFHLRSMKALTHISGIVLNYGNYDLSLLPSVRALDKNRPLILTYEDASQFLSTYLPDKTIEERKAPLISPMYNDLSGLVPALFVVGTDDGLTDDTILMGSKWQLAGNRAVVKFIPGAPHGFMTFDGNEFDITRQAWEIMIKFLKTTI